VSLPRCLGEQRIIGLTGSLGTGKTTVADYARSLGIPVFDADAKARTLLDPGSPLTLKVIAHFGSLVRQDSGSLNRLALAEVIFRDPQARQWLEALIHPQVRLEALRFIESHQDPLIILDIPLLLEAEMTDMVNEIWVVTCTSSQQDERIHLRHPQWSREHIQERLAHQWPLDQKIAWADVVLDNSGSLAELEAQIRIALGRLAKKA